MFNDFKGFVLLSISFFIAIVSNAQGLGNSPYSRIGIGDGMSYKGNIRNMGMGYAGSSLSSKDYMNVLNPAGLANFKHQYNDSLVKFDVGFTIQYKSFKFDDTKASSSGANINNIAFTVPISKVYTSGLMLSPLTIVQNKYSYKDSVANDPNNYSAMYKYLGNGGVYQLQWMNGVGITKNLALGMTIAYNFGSITQEATSQIITDPNYPDAENEVGANKKTNYSGVSFKPGVLYKRQIFQRKKTISYSIDSTIVYASDGTPYYAVDTTRIESVSRKITPINFKFGASAELFPGVKATETQSLFVRNPRNLVTSDSTVSKTRSTAYFPTTYRVGASFENPGYWLVAADFVYTDWSNFDKNKAKDSELNSASYTFAIGGEIIPRNFVKNSNKIYRGHRVKTYRAGFSYTATPINIAGKTLYDYAFSVGTSIPVGVRSKGSVNTAYVPILPKVSVAFVVGQRSTFTATQLSETYFRLQLSMTLYDKWFHKRRIQ
ncbi:hypothetical protein [Cytophaga aurantiaca]|uniref:hypothetical protein n=1 Tax=Cytophaga aurantiaca TaxID=29530 RepID=UPI000366832A|nr:hypothetical protein [Cytophaga aurantiaca]